MTENTVEVPVETVWPAAQEPAAQPLPTFSEVMDSTTGWEEQAITRTFGMRMKDLAEEPLMLQRVGVFVLLKRQGKADTEAYPEVMSMPFSAVTAHYADEEQEQEQGKA